MQRRRRHVETDIARHAAQRGFIQAFQISALVKLSALMASRRNWDRTVASVVTGRTLADLVAPERLYRAPMAGALSLSPLRERAVLAWKRSAKRNIRARLRYARCAVTAGAPLCDVTAFLSGSCARSAACCTN